MAEKKKPADKDAGGKKPRAMKTAEHAPRSKTRSRKSGQAAAGAEHGPMSSSPELVALLDGESPSPHDILGAHAVVVQGVDGVAVRALMPNAIRAECLLDGGRVAQMSVAAEGRSKLFAAFLPGARLPIEYRIRFYFADGAAWERGDPYRFLPTVGEMDLHLFTEGTHNELWKRMGAHARVVDGEPGVSFAVWAPNARAVRVVGDFCGWDGRVYPMRSLGNAGLWELFIPDIRAGALYKYEMLTREGAIRVKTDPFAFKLEQSPGTASIVEPPLGSYEWSDAAWMQNRPAYEALKAPVSIYEVHLGSWARVPENGGRSLTYREIAPRLSEHVRRLGFTHVELMPVMEHPFYGSWGYQVSGYYAPTSRYGTPDDFRFLVDTLHQNGIGVILDWVPAHFPKDDHALRRFDGTALYEHEDPRLGEHPDWGTLIFNFDRKEVRNFLVANALYWLQEYHADGLRVDAVASMLYLDYSRKAGEWLRNQYGGRENLGAIELLRTFNEAVRTRAPGCFTVAEESTAWPGVTKPVSEGGLGFTFKWNMGWMHDTLQYLAVDPLFRRYHQDQITFAMLYEYSEHFIMPLSHDEVVHLKGSLLTKMPGDEWQRMANLRLMLAYQFTRPGKKLVFMGTELAPWTEWNHEASLDWHLLDADPNRAAMLRFVSRLGALYRETPAFWRDDRGWAAFRWIDVADRENSVIAYHRCAENDSEHAVVVINFTPVPREHYRVGVPALGRYRVVLSTDAMEWGGTGFGAVDEVYASQSPFHGYEQSVELTLPPLGALVLAPAK